MCGLLVRIGTIVAILVCLSMLAFGQKDRKCVSEYTNTNNVDSPTLRVAKLNGAVEIADGRLPLEDVCIFLFDEESKKIVLFTRPNANGEFRFKNVRNGSYRLVVKHHFGFYCAANISVQVDRTLSSHKGSLLVSMAPNGIDACSKVEIESK